MSTPNNAFETISTDNLATATGGTASGASSSTDALPWQLSPLVHSLKDLNNNSSNNAQNQNNMMMMGMVAALAARRNNG